MAAGDWSELFWQLSSHFGKMRREALLALAAVASAVADPQVGPHRNMDCGASKSS